MEGIAYGATDNTRGREAIGRNCGACAKADMGWPHTAQKIGRDYVIKAEDLKLVEGRKPGRPPKPVAAKAESGRKGAKKDKS